MKRAVFGKLPAAALLAVFALASADALAQNRGNKGGEMRGKDRADQVKQMNEEMRGEKGKAMKGEAMKEKARKKAKKAKN